MLRIFLFVMAIISASVIFATDPADLSKLTNRTIPGTAFVASSLVMIGFALWIKQ